MAMKRYLNDSSRWLRFADGQTVPPKSEFSRNYDPAMLAHHQDAGIVKELPPQSPIHEPVEPAEVVELAPEVSTNSVEERHSRLHRRTKKEVK